MRPRATLFEQLTTAKPWRRAEQAGHPPPTLPVQGVPRGYSEGNQRTSGGTSKRRTTQESETPYGQIKAYGGRKKRLDLIIAKPYDQLISSENMTCMTREKGPTAVQQLDLQGGEGTGDSVWWWLCPPQVKAMVRRLHPGAEEEAHAKQEGIEIMDGIHEYRK